MVLVVKWSICELKRPTTSHSQQWIKLSLAHCSNEADRPDLNEMGFWSLDLTIGDNKKVNLGGERFVCLTAPSFTL